MEQNKRVVWYEGMTLDPHHFQQQDRFYQSILDFRVSSVVNYDWGLTRLGINKDALTNGQFKLDSCSGVFPDGLAFQMPERDALPRGLTIDQTNFPATDEHVNVYLSIPSERVRGRNCLLPGESSALETRFLGEEILLVDDNSGKEERKITVVGCNFQLVCGSDPPKDYSSIKIAEVRRTPTGTFELNEAFIPACLSISASDYLMRLSRELVEVLVTERGLRWRQRQHPSSQREFTSSDAYILGYLNTINYYLPVLNHAHVQRTAHPEAFYRLLLSLAGQLTTFSTDEDIHPREFPPYDHSNLTTCFGKLENIIRQLLKVKPPESYQLVALEKHGESLYMGDLEERHISRGALLLLIVSSKGDIPDRTIIEELPKSIKISSKELIRKLAGSAVPGLKITYLQRPPAGFPDQPGRHYFKMEKDGEFWDGICQNLDVAFLITGVLKSVDLELAVILTE